CLAGDTRQWLGWYSRACRAACRRADDRLRSGRGYADRRGIAAAVRGGGTNGGDSMSRIGILVVDDHPLFRRGVRMGLESERDLLVVAEVSDGPAALHAADLFAPDVVLLDVSLPTTSGFDVARAIKRRHPRATIVILTMHEDDGHLFA